MGEKLEPKSALPVGIAERKEIAALGRAGIVDQNIQPAKFAPRRLDQCRGGACLAQVERHDGGLDPLAANGSGDLVERSGIPPGRHHIAALIGQRQRNAPPDAAARAGDERNFSR
jgi:hypothetical protein